MTAQLDPELGGAVIALAALIGLIDDAEAESDCRPPWRERSSAPATPSGRSRV